MCFTCLRTIQRLKQQQQQQQTPEKSQPLTRTSDWMMFFSIAANCSHCHERLSINSLCKSFACSGSSTISSIFEICIFNDELGAIPIPISNSRSSRPLSFHPFRWSFDTNYEGTQHLITFLVACSHRKIANNSDEEFPKIHLHAHFSATFNFKCKVIRSARCFVPCRSFAIEFCEEKCYVSYTILLVVCALSL